MDYFFRPTSKNTNSVVLKSYIEYDKLLNELERGELYDNQNKYFYQYLDRNKHLNYVDYNDEDEDKDKVEDEEITIQEFLDKKYDSFNYYDEYNGYNEYDEDVQLKDENIINNYEDSIIYESENEDNYYFNFNFSENLKKSISIMDKYSKEIDCENSITLPYHSDSE